MRRMEIEVRDDLGGRARTLIFNRPAKKNALTVGMYATMAERLDEAATLPRVRAVVMTGAADAFTSGNDLADFMAHPSMDGDHHVVKFLKALVRFPKPLIAAVNGLAIGIGTTMLLHCDLVLAVESARFQLPFVKLGLSPEGGSSLLLPRLAGYQRASELLMWGEIFDAPTAYRIGLANAVYPQAELDKQVAARLERLFELPPDAVATAKDLIRKPLRDELERTMTHESVIFGQRLGSAEATEAFTAFFEKRKPRFA
jgi:enoyl-CoA hydratase/carnithine racemase